MPYDSLTGNIIVDIQYRLVQTDASSHLEEHGIIDYDLALGSGTGNSQVNDVWYNDRVFTTTDSINLASLSLKRFGQTFTTSFLGVSDEGNIKGVKIDNKSGESLFVNLPFRRFSGSMEVAASGSVLLSNAIGWTISTGNVLITLSGSTSNSKNYSIGFLGCALPSVVDADHLLHFEHLSSGLANAATGMLMIEYLSTGTLSSGILHYETNIANSSIDLAINIENLLDIYFGATGTGTGIGSGTGTMMPIDFLGSYSLDGEYLNIGWTGMAESTGGSGTGFSELLSNPMIIPGCVEYSQIGDTGVGFTVGYPGWYASGDYITLAGSAGGGGIFADHILGATRYGQTMCSNPDWFTARCVKCRQRSYLKQAVTVVPGATYRFTWYPYSMQMGIGQTVYPYMQIVAGGGGVIHKTNVTQPFLNTIQANPNNGKHSVDVVATDTSLSVEFHKAADVYPNVNPYGSPDYSTKMAWGFINAANRVSLYRVA